MTRMAPLVPSASVLSVGSPLTRTRLVRGRVPAAAASFAALLLWLYYSAQIFLLGAEFTAVMGGTRVDKERKGRARKSP